MKSLCLKLACLSLALLACFGLSRTASAAITELTTTKYPWDNSNIVSIPEHSENAVFMCGYDLKNGNGDFDFSLNGVSATALYTQYNGFSADPFSVAYITDVPAAGNYSYSATYTGTRYWGICFLFDGVDTANLVEDISTQYDSTNITATSTAGNLNLIIGAGANGGNGYSGAAINGNNFTLLDTYTANGQIGAFIGYQIATTTSVNFTYSEAGSGAWWYGRERVIKINAKSSAVPSSDYLLYYGDYFSYTPIQHNFDLPVVYDVCSAYGTSTGTLYLEPQGLEADLLLPSQELTGCSGAVRYNQYSGSSEMNEDAYFQIYDSVQGELASSSIFSLTIYNPVVPGSYLVNDSGNTFLTDTYNKTGTSTINFHYNVCSDPDYSSSDKIYLRNKQDGDVLTSFYRTISSCSGTSTIDISYNSNFYWYFNADLVYQNSVDLLSVQSDPFIVGFSPISKPTSGTSSSVLDISAHDLACSAAEWEDIENTSNWFNLNGIKCHSFETLLNIAFAVADAPKSFLLSARDTLLTSFPFNIPVQIKSSFDKSTPSLPDSLSYWGIVDGQGNLSISLPAEWTASSSEYYIPVWGEGVLSPPGSREAAFFAGVRSFSTFIIWFLLVSYFIYLGYRIYDDITGEDEGDFELTSINYDKNGNYSASYRPRK